MKKDSLQNILDRLAHKGWAIFNKVMLDEVIAFVQEDFLYRWTMTGGGYNVMFEITGEVVDNTLYWSEELQRRVTIPK